MTVFAGDLRQIVDGTRIRARFNNTGVDIEAGVFVKLATTGDRHIILPAAVADDLEGVTMQVIKAGTWGDVQDSGVARVVAGAAIATPGLRLTVNTAGRVIPWTAAAGANAANVGTSVTAATGDGVALEVRLSGPNVSRQG